MGATELQLHLLFGAARAAVSQREALAFTNGLATAALLFYVGHGRYGSGPDFDRPVQVEWRLHRGGWRTFDDLSILEAFLRRYFPMRRPEDVLTEAVLARRCVLRSNLEGNVPIGVPTDSFGGRLYRLAIESDLGGPLAPPIEQSPASRALIFYACHSAQYVPPLRSNGTVSGDDTVLATVRDVAIGAEHRVLDVALAHVIEPSSAETLRRDVNKAMRDNEPGWTSGPFRLYRGA